MLKRLIFVLLGLPAGLLPAQTILTEISESNIPVSKERWIVPQRYRTFQLDRAALQAVLNSVQGRNTAANRTGEQAVITLPLPDGGTARFRLTESTVMAPGLQARYPEIRCYTGYGLDDPSALLKCEWTPQGFHALWWTAGKGTILIDPYSPGDTDHYVLYNKKDYLPKDPNRVFSCGVRALPADPEETEDRPFRVTSRSSDGQLRQYRLALACTGEYAQFHGGTKPLALAAMVTSMNRVNGVYEREFSVTMQIVAGNDTLIFLDGATDPYDDGNGDAMLGQNRQVCNGRIGFANYDMGHVFSTGGGGIADLRSVCTNTKAEGVTGQEAPIGDAFDIDYVAHEMGHQFGGNHTQNNDCNRNDGTAVEPGSGSSIMGYAGICAPDVQPHSDDYFHGLNVEEILNYIENGKGGSCPVEVPTGNVAPEVNAGPDYVIPKSTPFVLTAQGSDADGDANILTYCWEQMDPESATMPPVAGSTMGPLFRSFNPDTLPSRYFPRLKDLVTNISPDWEKIPSAGRKMKFRVTFRDNHPAGGRTAQDDLLVTVSSGAGPFRVSAPGLSASWHSGEYQIVTWDVANTDKTPVNCKTVDIRLSTDGGLTYPLLLAAGVPNTGKHCIRVPEVETAKARVMVAAADNIFFDISNYNFSISPATVPAFTMCPAVLSGKVCFPGAYAVVISTSALAGFDTPVTLTASGVPAGAVATFSPNPVAPGQDAVLTLQLPNGSPEGNFDISITGTADSSAVTVSAALTVVSNDFSQLTLQSPPNGASGQDQSPVLKWQGVNDANAYDLEVATSPAFDAPALKANAQNTVATSYQVPVLLEKGRVYYWRVRPVNECGAGKWVGPFAFSTLLNVCTTLEAKDLPKPITATQTVTVESKIAFTGNTTISDVNIAKIQGSHQFFKEIEVSLLSPKGTELLLFKNKCGGYSGNFNFGFDDASATPGPTCPPSTAGTLFRPDSTLSKFNGENAQGDWILRIKDGTIGSGGTLSGFALELCANTTLNPPVLVNNNTLFIEPGQNKAVSTDLLKTADVDNTDDELQYTLMTVPTSGHLQLNWAGGALAPGAQFTQTDLNNGGLEYFDYGSGSPGMFCFAVTDGEGGLVADCFTIQPLLVGTTEPGRSLEFRLSPNPATESLRVGFPGAVASDTRIRLLDTSGRLLRDALLSSGGQQSLLLNVAGLPQGVYLVTADNSEGHGVRKVVVR